MKVLVNKCKNPYYNLALEEYIFSMKDQNEYVIIWQNDNSIIVGKHQNTNKEINMDKAKEYKCNIVRRNTGGGTVYHDMGNINYSYIFTTDGTDRAKDDFVRNLIRFLFNKGVIATISGKNDILVGTQKISGCAQMQRGSRVLFHGALLYSADLNKMKDVLNVSKSKLQSKGIESIKSRVANVSQFINEPSNKEAFINDLEKWIINIYNADLIKIESQWKKEVTNLVQNKYLTWEWNYGKDPECNYYNIKRFESGEIEIYLEIEKHRIKGCKIKADFVDNYPVEKIKKILIGKINKKNKLYKN